MYLFFKKRKKQNNCKESRRTEIQKRMGIYEKANIPKIVYQILLF